jgi:hypothetical protein
MEYGLEWRFETSSKKFSVRVLQHELMQLWCAPDFWNWQVNGGQEEHIGCLWIVQQLTRMFVSRSIFAARHSAYSSKALRLDKWENIKADLLIIHPLLPIWDCSWYVVLSYSTRSSKTLLWYVSTY